MASTKTPNPTRSGNTLTVVTTTATFNNLTRAIYVAVAGDLTVREAINGTAVTIENAPVGYHPVEVQQIDATGTTATGIIAIF